MKVATMTPVVFADQTRWTIMYVPRAGLFHDLETGEFRDGKGNPIPALNLQIYTSRNLAEYAATVVSKRPQYKHGSIVVIPVTVRVSKPVKEI